MKARTLKAAILRKLGFPSLDFLSKSRKIDPLDMGILYEYGLQKNDVSEWEKAMGASYHNYLELSLDYVKAGFYDQALAILSACERTCTRM